MPREPILTIGDIEPERPTVAINRNAPDGPWQAFKHRHFDVLLRWLPVRYKLRRDLYPLRSPSEFGIRTIARISAAQREIAALEAGNVDQAATRRTEQLLRDISALILDAPRSVIDALSATQHIQLLMAFAASATGKTPTTLPTENPPTSDDSSPDSAASTPVTAGMTG